jgi:pimeloyl-ACP methyl ester carboxylesterase
MAGDHPDRVAHLVYLDGAYDWADYKVAFAAMPQSLLKTPADALSSIDAYVSYKRAVEHPRVLDAHRIEAYLRAGVFVQTDGTVKSRIAGETWDALLATLLNDRRDYRRVRAPALALYADSLFDPNIADADRRALILAWEREYMVPFRRESVQRVRRELAHVRIVHIPGAHNDLHVTCRDQVVGEIRRFLTEGPVVPRL